MRFVLVLLLPSCMPCDLVWATSGMDDNKLDVVHGDTNAARPDDRIQFAMDSLDFHAGSDKCSGHWYVNGIEGGSREVGIITRCGVYIATDWPRESQQVVLVEATENELGGCADCCAYNEHTVTLLPTWPRWAHP